jgi:hypothetical protein
MNGCDDDDDDTIIITIITIIIIIIIMKISTVNRTILSLVLSPLFKLPILLNLVYGLH